MKKKIVFAFTCLLLWSCGTHRVVNDNRPVQGSVPVQTGKTDKVEEVEKKVQYEKEPWVKNLSRPFEITQGLQDRHVSLWASHGYYYDIPKGTWKWQRPSLFGTTEDLFTQTIVVPYLIPMLEKAGANVFTPRERDWQKHELIVDNDHSQSPNYMETNTQNKWKDADVKGFALHQGAYHDGENPFLAGTARMAKTTHANPSLITYQPQFEESGSYAVYVSYPTLENSVDNVQYTVYHQGQASVFSVNQRMGGSTWVYLGTFHFDRGCSRLNSVVVSNLSDQKGVVTSDAVRFGGGMGNITRAGSVSGMPRALEGARYYAQWAGAPYEVYSSKNGQDDYADDINVRSLMTNWIGGGSRYMPTLEGKHVPIELSLAVHSDAGYAKDFASLTGSLGIYTTNFHDGLLNNGDSRDQSRIFASLLLNNQKNDLNKLYGLDWPVRDIRDANYSETRLPEVPSAIMETLSHQNFPDMRLAQDPTFRFALARSVYKSILQFLSNRHDKNYVVAPLPPQDLRVEFTGADEVTLSWEDQDDPLEKTAKPTSYVVYTSKGAGGFDNGQVIKSRSCKMNLQPGVIYNFKVSAINKGGESFPSETLTALHHAGATRSIMIVNGFRRLAPPAVRNTTNEQGFDFDIDPGVSDGTTAGWGGKQICFDKSKAGLEGPGAFGYSGQEWEGQFLVGNEFNYPTTHAEAMRSMLQYNVTSCSASSVESGKVDLMKYHLVDMLYGLEKKDPNALGSYKTFPSRMQDILTKYTRSGGALLVSGAYLGCDMRSKADSTFMRNILKVSYGGTIRNSNDSIISGMGTTLPIYRMLNEEHYAATSTDVLNPLQPAYCALTYSNGTSACVAYDGNDYKSFTIGFPFECITSPRKRAAVMKAIINFLIP